MPKGPAGQLAECRAKSTELKRCYINIIRIQITYSYLQYALQLGLHHIAGYRLVVVKARTVHTSDILSFVHARLVSARNNVACCLYIKIGLRVVITWSTPNESSTACIRRPTRGCCNVTTCARRAVRRADNTTADLFF